MRALSDRLAHLWIDEREQITGVSAELRATVLAQPIAPQLTADVREALAALRAGGRAVRGAIECDDGGCGGGVIRWSARVVPLGDRW